MSSKEKYLKEIFKCVDTDDLSSLYSCYLTFLGSDLERGTSTREDYFFLFNRFWEAILKLDHTGVYLTKFSLEVIYCGVIEREVLSLFYTQAVHIGQRDMLEKRVWPIFVRYDMSAKEEDTLYMDALIPVKDTTLTISYLHELFLQEGCGRDIERIVKDPSFRKLFQSLSLRNLLLLYFSLEDCQTLEGLIKERMFSLKERIEFLLLENSVTHLEEISTITKQFMEAKEFIREPFIGQEYSLKIGFHEGSKFYALR